jgi:hypothetical protein
VTTSSAPLPFPIRRPGHQHHRKRRRTTTASRGTDAGSEVSGDVGKLKVDEPEDLLALIPYLLGFPPQESLVMLVICDGAVKVTVRVDLVDDVVGVAQRFGAIAVTNRATGIVLIAYSADPALADAMLLPVTRRLSSFGVLEAIYTDGGRWWSRQCPAGCCPPEGTPYDTSNNRLAAEAVYHGMSCHADRSEIERLVDGPSAEQHDDLSRIADDLVEEVLRPGLAERRLQMRELVGDYVRRRAGGDPVILSDHELITFALLAIDPVVRDEAWALIDRDDAWIHVQLWGRVVARAVPTLAPPPLCLLGIAAWIQGQGTLQVCCLERVRKLAPHYSMADILEDINLRAVPPSFWDTMKDSLREALDDAYSRVGGQEDG